MTSAIATLLVLALVCATALLLKPLFDFETALADAEQRLRRLRAFSGEALRLAESRGRFRRRQRNVERVVDACTTGVENAHRTLTGYRGHDYRGASFYDSLRRINRTLGRRVSEWLAPRARPARNKRSGRNDR